MLRQQFLSRREFPVSPRSVDGPGSTSLHPFISGQRRVLESYMPCGICGFVGLSDKALLKSMCDIMRHRGPDDTGYFIDGSVGLGVDRLSIIDLKTGDQPIHNEEGSIWVIQNGEIYNYGQLKEELESLGHRFYTESDSETIVHAYEEWGDQCPNHFRGMFALAIWDGHRRRLFIARDRFGKKPLYYHFRNGLLLFGSEMKAVLQFEGVPRRINPVAMDLYFSYGYIPAPHTIFQDVSKLPAGHSATYENGSLKLKQYWDFGLSPQEVSSESATVDRLYETMKEAVRLRLRSDVPLGAFLSGGIDSSTVVAFMQLLSSRPVKTFSIGFNDSLSEAKYARRVADYLGTDHQEYTVTPDAFRILPKLAWHFDEPFADHSLIPTYYLSELTARQVTVALSGDGGDEMFMGYPFLTEPKLFRIYSKMPASIRRTALKTVIRLPIKGSFTRMADHALTKDYGSQSPYERFAMRVTMLDESGLRKLYSQENLSRHQPSNTYSYLLNLLGSYSGDDFLNAADIATVKSYLEDDILVKVDRMSMANSLEVRCPLLDQDLASLVATMPSDLKLRGRTSKYILKRMTRERKLIPQQIILRKKKGFGAPVHSWMGRDWRDLSQQVLEPIISANYTGLFNREFVRDMLRDSYVNANRIFALIMFVLWYKIYMEGEKLSVPLNGIDALA